MWRIIKFSCVLMSLYLIIPTTANSTSSLNDITKESTFSKEVTSVQQLYDEGVKDYLDNNYDGCIVTLERAIGMFNSYMGNLRRCHIQCHDEVMHTEPLYSVDIENLLFYEKAIKNTLCLLKCKKRVGILDSMFMEESTEQIFEMRKPYEYLQACYAHKEQYQKAANAAFTYLVVNPNDSGVVKSLQHYTQQADVDINSIVNHEAKDYVYLYVHGTQAYEKKRWDEVIQNMEASLDSFLHEEEECRTQCEGPFFQPELDFMPSIANHFTHVLLCKRKCNDRLSTLNGEKHDDLLPSHYHYLQYAYFKVGKLKDACQAVASYLLFYPMDKTMMHNVDFYKSLPKVREDYFEARSEAKKYIHRHTYETRIIDYVKGTFTTETANLYEDNTPKDNDANTIKDNDAKEQHGSSLFTTGKPKIKRFVMHDFISSKECASLMQVANQFAIPGDGYQTGSDSPHTVHENYYGLSLKRATNLLRHEQMDLDSFNTILNVTSRMKHSLEEQFQVSKRLHFAYTHLVCRRAKLDTGPNRTDFSHPVHADNCNIQINGTCPKTWPAFTWRDYTAILYLNDDFAGGEFFFSKDYYGTHIEEQIQPKCGRLVGFTSGKENLHGVQAIREGNRCALAIWFTYDHKNVEEERKLLYKILIPNK